jgi:hypothetical protein
VKVLFSALHHAYFRNFESAVRELAARGHQVHLVADEREAPQDMGGLALVQRLAAELPGVTWDLLPSLEEEAWFDTARKLRLGLDYARAREPRYASARKLSARARDRAPRLIRWLAGVPGIGARATRATLTRIERLMPRSARLEAYVRSHAPDVVVLASLTYARSQQLDLLKAARAARVPVAAAIMSWDHLSSKALVHLAPDMVLVWNDVQRGEAVDMHGLPADRVVVTGAQCYDQWFGRVPRRSREEFCRAMGLRPDRPFALWVHSALSPTPQPPEPLLVIRWIEALRRSADPRLQDLGVLVRPHPERLKEWVGIDLSHFANVVFRGRNPIDPAAKDDYFDALYYSSAVIGLVTSAFLEAAVVGRPVMTFTLPEYRIHQEEMVHFQYLTNVAGGLLWTAPDVETHLGQLAQLVNAGPSRDERNSRFVTEFVRPAGLEQAATPLFVDALERLQRGGTHGDPTLDRHAWLRPAVAAAATAVTRSRAGQWLLSDTREDAVEEQKERKRRIVAARIATKLERQDAKRARKAARQRHETRTRRIKQVKHAFAAARYATAKGVRRRFALTRYHVAVACHRALAFAGIERDRLPDQRKD